MKCDGRYKHVGSVWKAGDLLNFLEIFAIIPRSVVSKDMGLNYDRFMSKVKKPGLFTFQDIRLLSDLTGVDFMHLVTLVDKRNKEIADKRAAKFVLLN